MNTDLSDHPLVKHYLAILRDHTTQAADFRRASTGITQVVVMEAARLLETEQFTVQTPLEPAEAERLVLGTVFVPILRAGLGMLDPAMSIIPDSSVGYIGLERDEETAVASCYYAKMPDMSKAGHIMVLDPMLATGGSAIQCIDQLKARGAKKISMLAIIGCPEGVTALKEAHPDVSIIVAKIDRELNDKKYILPGLGDFGDRLFNT